MGTLVAKCYPTKLFLKSADHTYVECSSGIKNWGCWGGKKNGKYLTSGEGSTKRANAIAEPNEKAGIKRYLIDGVCHQSANRILLPARILVSQAKGYRLSSSVFGTYGKSLFNQHTDISGDLPECHDLTKQKDIPKNEDLQIISANFEIYNKYSNDYSLINNSLSDFYQSLISMQTDIFTEEVKIWAGEQISSRKLSEIKDAKKNLEKQLLSNNSTILLEDSDNPIEFIQSFEKIINGFQSNIADILNDSEYKTLLKLNRDERISLIDPEALDLEFGAGTFEKAFPKYF
jgi:hypothetical protein